MSKIYERERLPRLWKFQAFVKVEKEANEDAPVPHVGFDSPNETLLHQQALLTGQERVNRRYPKSLLSLHRDLRAIAQCLTEYSVNCKSRHLIFS